MSLKHSVEINLCARAHSYNVVISHDILRETAQWVNRSITPHPKKIAVVSNEKVFGYYGDAVTRSLEHSGFEVSNFLMKDGEEFKNFDSLRDLLRVFSANNLGRSDCVIALGGGVVGDIAGFASAIYLRGVRFMQIPTTLLSMIDSSVGGKTGINDQTGKNLLGAFHQPHGVLIDVSTLKTLEHRELAAGFCEVIKHGALAGDTLFAQTAKFLDKYPIGSFPTSFENDNFVADLSSLIYENVDFKSEIVVGDEFEDVSRTDPRSRKILNFGHTVAHALEKVTNYTYFKHGEAVGYGILAAAEISKELDILDANSIRLLNDVVLSLGHLPETKQIDVEKVMEAFIFDKKTIDQSLHWVLLKAIGQPTIVHGKTIPRSIIEKSLLRTLAA